MEKYYYKVMVATWVCLLLLAGLEAYPMSDTHGDEVVVTAEYTYVAPSTVGEDEAKDIALKRAKLKAVEDHFGTTLQQANTTTVRNGDAHEGIDFVSLSSSEVMGEWVETIGKPQYSVFYEGGLVVKVKVRGIIRKIDRSQTAIDVKILCNGTSDKFERSDFRAGDDLFIRFASPVNGYLAVYLCDTHDVFCLLPYPDDPGHASKVEAGKERILFSYNHNPLQENVRQYHMTCQGGMETNMIYVVFSQKNFDKAIDSETSRSLPRQLTVEEFSKWLAKCKRRDHDFQVKEYPITISQ